MEKLLKELKSSAESKKRLEKIEEDFLKDVEKDPDGIDMNKHFKALREFTNTDVDDSSERTLVNKLLDSIIGEDEKRKKDLMDDKVSAEEFIERHAPEKMKKGLREKYLGGTDNGDKPVLCTGELIKAQEQEKEIARLQELVEFSRYSTEAIIKLSNMLDNTKEQTLVLMSVTADVVSTLATGKELTEIQAGNDMFMSTLNSYKADVNNR